MSSPLPSPYREVLTEEQTGFSQSTLRVYRASWRDLLNWMHRAHREETDVQDGKLPPPEAIAGYLRDQSHLAWSTLTSRRQAIRLVFDELGEEDPFEHPAVTKAWETVRRQKHEETSELKKRSLQDREYRIRELLLEGPSLLRDHLGRETYPEEREDMRFLEEKYAEIENLTPRQRALLPELTYDLQVLRNRLLLLLVSSTDVSKAALTRIDVEDVYPPEQEGGPTEIVIYRRSGDPSYVLVLESAPEPACCPNRAVAAWILAADLTEGPLFRSFTPHGEVSTSRIRPQTINYVINRCAENADLEEGEQEN